MPTDNIPVLSEVFGSTPNIVPYTETILSDEQIKALKADLDAMPFIKSLGGQYYDYMLGLMNRSIPGFSDILAQGGQLTKTLQSVSAEELAGKIPQDVVDQVTRSTAFQNLGSGLFAGPMGQANQARNLGLTSLDMIKMGMGTEQAAGNAAQQWANIANGLNMNPASFFITPSEQAAMTMQNNLYKQMTQQRAENQAAAPNPVAKGISDTIINLIGAYLGKGGGGGGTAPNYLASSAQGQAGIGGAGPFGSSFGGTNVYSATTGGFNFGGNNFGGTDIPYMGGNVATPSGAGYGLGTSGFGVGTPGYLNQIGAAPVATAVPQQNFNQGSIPPWMI